MAELLTSIIILIAITNIANGIRIIRKNTENIMAQVFLYFYIVFALICSIIAIIGYIHIEIINIEVFEKFITYLCCM